MDVDVPVVEDAVVNAQHVGMGLHVLQCQHGTLLHDVTQVTCQRELGALALRQRGLNKQNLATYARPCQTRYHTGIVIALVDVAVEGRFAQQVLNLVGRHLQVGQLTVLGLAQSQLAEALVNLLLQLTDTALAGILFDNLLDGGFVEVQLLLCLQSVVLLLLRHEVTLGNLDFLLGDVAAHLNNLHAVE